ncbi:ECF RNA polymerase sigma factor SigW [Gimesia alba]|uniref:ECF RNA polymerase sigma factor SigW n=1 Tax=Gimesia alba TaxID=2527973 RepID=A0A517RKU7_9PLAN|nr:sigma-70 family RNA polymerase sigma factor [Gimesia alba]QDT44497.1 ECF RNA polymerase sigma factor SigW [Gimesia alba]
MTSTAELVKSVMCGERAAFAELVRRYERLVLTTVWSVVKDYHLAQDVTQDVFLAAYENLQSLRSPALFGPWVARIAERRAALVLRRRQIDACSLDTVSEIATPPVVEGDEAELHDVLAAIQGLPQHERAVVLLRYVDGHSVRVIAELTGRPVGTVTKQLSRALERLQKILRKVEV